MWLLQKNRLIDTTPLGNHKNAFDDIMIICFDAALVFTAQPILDQNTEILIRGLRV